MKIVHVSREDRDTEVQITGAKAGSNVAAIVLASAKPEDENTLEQPNGVAPVTETLICAGTNLRHVFPANSVTVLRVPLR